jgi:hypothetical protein
MNQESENMVARLLQTKLNIKFEKGHHKLGDWGYVDMCSEICSDRFVFFEVEEGQKHPCTNVLKVWPYLETHGSHKVFLIQSFFRKNVKRRSSRRELSQWTGRRLTQTMRGRFHYCKITVSANCKEIDDDDEKNLRREFKKFREGRPCA